MVQYKPIMHINRLEFTSCWVKKMEVVLMKKLGELSETEGSMKQFTVSFELCFTLNVTKHRKSLRPRT